MIALWQLNLKSCKLLCLDPYQGQKDLYWYIVLFISMKVWQFSTGYCGPYWTVLSLSSGSIQILSGAYFPASRGFLQHLHRKWAI